MKRLICIANSRRPDGRCVAAIDVDTGEFIRPVARQSDAIPERRVYFGGRLLAVGDKFEVDLQRPRQISPYQRENRIIVNWNWKYRGRVSLKSLVEYCDGTTPLLHSTTDRVNPATLDQLLPEQWQSLQLVRLHKPRFERDARDQHRWRVWFRDKAGGEYYLKITDPVVTHKLETGKSIGGEVLLLVSLTKPWAPPDGSKPPMCFKLVATVIER